MSLTVETTTSGLAKPWPNLERLMSVLGNTPRLKMLRELSLGEAREIRELASAAGCTYESAVKHLAVLLRSGFLTRGRGGVYLMDPKYLPVTGARVVDFGWVTLRLEDLK